MIILAKDEHGRLYDVEVQTTRPTGLRQRLAYYAASLLVGQFESGDDYHELRPSIGICLLDAIEFRKEAALHHSFQLRTEVGLPLTDCLRIHLFELPKYVPPSDNRVITDSISGCTFSAGPMSPRPRNRSRVCPIPSLPKPQEC